MTGRPSRRAGATRAGFLALSLAGAVALAAPARAQAPEVQVTAVPEYTAVRPGSAFRVAVRLQLPAGWHIGWINPGAGGLATTLAWHATTGVSAGAVEWPYPETDEAGADVTHVYRGSVVLFSWFAAAPGVAGRIEMTGDLGWGLCRGVCIQQHRTVKVSLPVAHGHAARAPGWSEAAAAIRFLPMHEPHARFVAIALGDSLRLGITGLRAGPAAGSWATFFPLEPGRPSVVVAVRATANGVALLLPRSVAGRAPANRLVGVLVAAHPPGVPPPVRAIAVDAPVTR